MGGLGVHSTADWVTAKISDCFARFVSVCDDCLHISIECKSNKTNKWTNRLINLKTAKERSISYESFLFVAHIP